MISVRSIDQDHLYKNILEEVEEINSSKILCEKNILLAGTSRTSDIVQRFLYHKNSDFYNRVLKPVLCDAIFKAENQSEGAGEICLNITLEKIQEGLRQISLGEDIRDVESNIYHDLNRIFLQTQKFIKNPSKTEIESLLGEFITRESQLSILNMLLSCGISTSPVFVEKSNKRETVIDVQGGFIFNIGASPDFILGRAAWKRKNVSCLVIDGIIESIGEIHHLLERASEDKNPYILFVRGMSDEVSQTIKLNLSRSTIDVMPICVGFDENTLNILNDIAICTDSHLVSSYTGDLISKAAMGPFPMIQSVEVTENKLILITESDREKISSHLKYLNSKRDDAHAPELRDLISNRIRCLTEGKIVLNVGTDLVREEPTVFEIFDKCLRAMGSVMKEGIIEDNDLDIFKYIAYRRFIPSLSVYFGLSFSKSCIHSILSMGHCLLTDD